MYNIVRVLSVISAFLVFAEEKFSP
jgi:hypothetical protein